jgi:hypothetical protein
MRRKASFYTLSIDGKIPSLRTGSCHAIRLQQDSRLVTTLCEIQQELLRSANRTDAIHGSYQTFSQKTADL